MLVPPQSVTKGRSPPAFAPLYAPGIPGPKSRQTIESAIEAVIIGLLVIVVADATTSSARPTRAPAR